MSDSIGDETVAAEPELQEGEATGEDADQDAAPGEAGKRRRRRRRKKKDSSDYLPADERASLALEFVMELLDELELDCEVSLKRPRPDAENEILLEITGHDSGRIIGKKGQVLGALQFLANRVVNRPGQERRYVTVDAEGYRNRRDSSLASMARKLGKQAVAEGKIITFEPMNPRDRRVVHMSLAKFEGVVTKSDGEGDQRRVQIIPIRRGQTDE